MKPPRSLYVLGILLLIAFKIILVRDQPLTAYTNAMFDDTHYVDQARSILQGGWLGPYSQYTLIKGPFISIWIVFTFLLGIPFLLSLQLLYAFACLVAVAALRPILRRPIYALILFSALLFNPITVDTAAATRVTRDALYASLCLLAIACATALYLRRNRPSGGNWPWAFGLGFAFAASAVTREETVWLVPSLALLLTFTWFGLSEKTLKGRILQLKVWAVLPAAYVLVVGGVSALNYHHYSVFAVTEMSAPQFVAAYSAIQRVVPVRFKPLIPVSRVTRAQLSRVSPAFRQLQRYFDGVGGKAWAAGDWGTQLWRPPRGEILGGWFMWAFRDAVGAAGQYANGRFPADYYQALANEVAAACDAGTLHCVDKPPSLAPVWHRAYISPAGVAFLRGWDMLVNFKGFSAHPATSSDSRSDLLLFRDLTHTEVSDLATNSYVIGGWAVNPEQNVAEVVTSDGGELGTDSIVQANLASPDVYDLFLARGKVIPEASSARFRIETSCTVNCALEISSGTTFARFPFAVIAPLYCWNDSSTSICFETMESSVPGLEYQKNYNLGKFLLLEDIGRLYQTLFPVLTVVSVLSLIVLTLRIRTKFDEWAVLVIFASTCIARIGLLSIISASSFYSMYNLYLAPAYPFLILFAVLALILLLQIMGPLSSLLTRGAP